MKENLSEIVFILDRSGSMSSMGTEPVDGYNRVISEQNKPEFGNANVSLVLFNESVEFVYENVSINDVNPLTKEEYNPCGMTSLLDAIGVTFDRVGKRLSNTPENERPSKVIVFILTDGQENSSKIYSKSKISEMIKEQTEKYSWIVDFMGTTEYALLEAKSYNINNTTKFFQSAEGLYVGYTNASVRMMSYRH